MSDADWAEVLGTNVTGVFYVTRAAIPALRASGGGWIINIASLAGRNSFPRAGAYCASKAALIAFTESVMQEVRFDNIHVSVIMPGSVSDGVLGHRERTVTGSSRVTTSPKWSSICCGTPRGACRAASSPATQPQKG